MNVLIISARADYGGGPEHIYQLIKNSSKDIEYFIACPKEKPYWDLYTELVGEKKIEIPHRKFSLFHLCGDQHLIGLILKSLNTSTHCSAKTLYGTATIKTIFLS